MRRVHVEPAAPREEEASGQVRPLPAPVD